MELIERQATIDALNEYFARIEKLKRVRLREKAISLDTVGIINTLPSAQPEIIRCKDCKHLQKWRSEESVKKFGQIYECARNVFDCPKPEDFCSHAERKDDDCI